MMEIIARVFDNGKLIGYQVTDGSATKLIDLNTAIFLAKTNKINNVKATQDGITGINGFELRKLPQINKPTQKDAPQKQPQASMREFTLNEKVAAVARLFSKSRFYGSPRKSIVDYIKETLKNEIASGEVDPNTLSILSPYIEILNELTDEKGKSIGYQIGYTGQQPLQLKRYEADINKYKQKVTYISTDSVLTINYGDTQYLNLREFSSLIIRPEISYTFSNSVYEPNILGNEARVRMNNDSELNKIQIYDVLDNDTIKQFFIPEEPQQYSDSISRVRAQNLAADYINKRLEEMGISGDTTSQQNSQAPKKSKEELREALKTQGLFNTFKH